MLLVVRVLPVDLHARGLKNARHIKCAMSHTKHNFLKKAAANQINRAQLYMDMTYVVKICCKPLIIFWRIVCNSCGRLLSRELKSLIS